jgi:hypothetical protein
MPWRPLSSAIENSDFPGIADVVRATVWLVVVLPFESAEAQSDWPRSWYAGVGIASTQVDAISSYGGSVGGVDYGRDTGYLIVGGYRWSRNVAFEIGYLDGGSPGITLPATQSCVIAGSCPIRLDQEITALEGSAAWIWPIGNIWELYVRGGAAIWNGTAHQQFNTSAPEVGTRNKVTKDGVDFMFSAGAGVMLGEHIHARVDYQGFGIDKDLLAFDPAHRGSYEQISLELHWRF